MSKLPSHAEDEPRAFLKLLCPNAIVLKSKVPKENILVKDELLSIMKEENIDLPSKGKRKPENYKTNGKNTQSCIWKWKKESIGLPKIENHQDVNTIACIDKIYKESFNKFMDFRWIAKFVVPLIVKTITTTRQHKFPKAWTQCTIRYTTTTCTTTIYEDSSWTNFANLFDLINANVFTYEHALNKFLNLMHFLFSWFEHRKNRGIPLVGPKHMPPSFWRLGPRKLEASWCSMSFIGDKV